MRRAAVELGRTTTIVFSLHISSASSFYCRVRHGCRSSTDHYGSSIARSTVLPSTARQSRRKRLRTEGKLCERRVVEAVGGLVDGGGTKTQTQMWWSVCDWLVKPTTGCSLVDLDGNRRLLLSRCIGCVADVINRLVLYR